MNNKNIISTLVAVVIVAVVVWLLVASQKKGEVAPAPVEATLTEVLNETQPVVPQATEKTLEEKEVALPAE